MNEIFQLSPQCPMGPSSWPQPSTQVFTFHKPLSFWTVGQLAIPSPVPLVPVSFSRAVPSAWLALPLTIVSTLRSCRKKGITGAHPPAVGPTGDLWKQMCSGPDTADIKGRVTVVHGHQCGPGIRCREGRGIGTFQQASRK